MNVNNRVKLAVYLVSGAWSVALLVAGLRLPGTEAKVLGYLPVVVVAVFAAFDAWIWRLSWLRPLVRRPNLNGTWRGSLVSMRADDSGNEVVHPALPVFIVIKQSYLDIDISLLSGESRSDSIAAVMQRGRDGDATIYYHYANTSGLAIRDRSRPHAGGARVDVSALRPAGLTGEYWTDRRTRGTYTAEFLSKRRYRNYQEALTAFDSGD